MNNPIALIGGEEFADGFEEVHARLLKLAGSNRGKTNGDPVRVTFLGICAAYEGAERVEYWCHEARQRLGALGASVMTPRIVDHDSADDPHCAALIAEADWIYLGGGHPNVGMQILQDTLSMEAMQSARQRGALISGASAGAMMLCQRSIVITDELDETVTHLIQEGASDSDWERLETQSLACLGYLPKSMCWPHMNQFFSERWMTQMLTDSETMLGIDEQTALVGEPERGWEVWGKGRVARYQVDSGMQFYTEGNHLVM
jgi:cyanophycinase-like exopeptidase